MTVKREWWENCPETVRIAEKMQISTYNVPNTTKFQSNVTNDFDLKKLSAHFMLHISSDSRIGYTDRYSPFERNKRLNSSCTVRVAPRVNSVELTLLAWTRGL
jgi:hypothetical protein